MLKDRLEEMKNSAASQIPAEKFAIMLRSREVLSASDILAGVIKVGAKVTDFTLNDALGTPVELAQLRSQGPVLLSIYRGVW